MMPHFFRDQLPDSIKKLSDNRLDGYSESATHHVEYTYMIKGKDGGPHGTSLGTVSMPEFMVPKTGNVVDLRGTAVEVVAVTASVESDGDATSTWYEVLVKEIDESNGEPRA